MKVKELIEILKGYDEDHLVVLQPKKKNVFKNIEMVFPEDYPSDDDENEYIDCVVLAHKTDLNLSIKEQATVTLKELQRYMVTDDEYIFYDPARHGGVNLYYKNELVEWVSGSICETDEYAVITKDNGYSDLSENELVTFREKEHEKF